MSIRVSIDGDDTGEAAPATRLTLDPYTQDRVDAFARGRTEQTAAWIREHPEWVSTDRNLAKLTSAHFSAVHEGHEPDAPGYFRSVEKALGTAPASRPAGYLPHDPNTHVDGNRVVLTKGEIESAENGTLVWNHGPKRGEPIGRTEMARRKAEMVREGRYNKA